MINFITSLNFTTVAILSAFLAAIANILARVLLKDIKSKDILGINFLIMTATLIIFSPFFYFFERTSQSILLVLSIGLIDGIANFFYFKSFEKSEASTVTPVISLAPVFAFLFGWLFVGEVIDLMQMIMAMLIVVGVIFVSGNFSKKFQTGSILAALISAILFGLSAIPSKILLSDLKALNSPTLYLIRGALIGLFATLFVSSKVKRITIKQYKLIFFRGLFVIAQWILLYIALFKGTVGVTITLVNITPIFVFILGIMFLREKPTWKKVAAATLVLILSFLL